MTRDSGLTAILVLGSSYEGRGVMGGGGGDGGRWGFERDEGWRCMPIKIPERLSASVAITGLLAISVHPLGNH